jgi:hypothetical protein
MPRKPVTGILQQDYRLMRSMAAGAVVRISVTGRPSSTAAWAHSPSPAPGVWWA